MDKLDPKVDGATPDIVGENIEKLKEFFPEVFTEGRIDLDALRETLGDYVDDRQEKYSFNWNGKSLARRIAQTPSTGTLRPCPEESVNWDNTENLFIEGDNLEVLKLLQKSYHKRVKMIYIDPPYNTGNDFIYPDNFADSIKNYMELTGQTDKEGKKLCVNPETSGRYHTNWLNMMLPRLKLARNLLSDNGIVFISIDDSEVANLRKLCDEIFGEENFVSTIIWQKVFSPKNTAKYFSEDHDYIIVYAKRKEIWSPQLIPRSDAAIARYSNPDDDPRGVWTSSDLTARNFYGEGIYKVTGPTGKIFDSGKGRYWRQNLEKFRELDADGRIWWGENGNNMPRLKRFLSEVKDGVVPQTLLLHAVVGNTQEAKKELLKYTDFKETENVLNSVKPTRLLCHLLKIGTSSNSKDIIFDFFAGSGSTAHATMLQNREDSGDRKFILVQIPEQLPKAESSVKTIADLAKSRIRNVAQDIKDTEDKNANGKLSNTINRIQELDLGFKVFKLDNSNIKPWDADFENLEDALLDAVENIKSDRSEEDVLYELLLKYGLDLTVPIEERQIAGSIIYIIGAGALIVCLSDEIGLEVVEGIAATKDELKPEVMRVVFKDAGFANDVVKTNAVQILRQVGIDDVKSL